MFFDSHWQFPNFLHISISHSIEEPAPQEAHSNISQSILLLHTTIAEESAMELYTSHFRIPTRRPLRKMKKKKIKQKKNIAVNIMLNLIFNLTDFVWISGHSVINQITKTLTNLLSNLITSFSTFFQNELTGFKTRRKKNEKEKYKSFQIFYFYTLKLLQVRKKRMLLINTKKTANNFWAWIRTQIIYFIPKFMPFVMNLYKKAKSIVKQVAKPFSFNLSNTKKELVTVNETIKRNLHRIDRKEKWFTRQNELRSLHKENYKSNKQYKIQIEEYWDYQKQLMKAELKKYKLESEIENINYYKEKQKEDREKKKYTLPKFRNFVVHYRNMLFKQIKSFYTKVIASNTLPTQQFVEPDDESTLFDFLKKKTFIIIKKFNWRFQKTLNYAFKRVKRQHVPPAIFQPLKKHYKRNRPGLFKHITKILTQQVFRDFPILTIRKQMRRSLKHLRKRWLSVVKKQVKVTAHKYYTAQFVTHVKITDLLKYNLLKFLNLIRNTEMLAIQPKAPTATTVLTDYLNTNYLELKRML